MEVSILRANSTSLRVFALFHSVVRADLSRLRASLRRVGAILPRLEGNRPCLVWGRTQTSGATVCNGVSGYRRRAGSLVSRLATPWVLSGCRAHSPQFH